MEDLDLIPGLGRFVGEGRGYPLQYCGLENSMDCHKKLDTTERHYDDDDDDPECKGVQAKIPDSILRQWKGETQVKFLKQ